MHTHARNNDLFDHPSMRAGKARGKHWESLLPAYKKLLKDQNVISNTTVLNVDPTQNLITLSNGTEIEYKYLVVATGLNEDYDSVEGLKEAITTDDVRGLRVGHPLGNPAYFYKRAWHIMSGLDSKAHGDAPYVSYSPSGEFIGKNFFYPHLAMGEMNLFGRHSLEIDPRTQVLDFRATIDGVEKFHNIDG